MLLLCNDHSSSFFFAASFNLFTVSSWDSWVWWRSSSLPLMELVNCDTYTTNVIDITSGTRDWKRASGTHFTSLFLRVINVKMESRWCKKISIDQRGEVTSNTPIHLIYLSSKYISLETNVPTTTFSVFKWPLCSVLIEPYGELLWLYYGLMVCMNLPIFTSKSVWNIQIQGHHLNVSQLCKTISLCWRHCHFNFYFGLCATT